MQVIRQNFGEAPSGEPIELFTLRSPTGFQAQVTNWGATVTSILAQDATGSFDDVVLGYDSLKRYINNEAYYGATIGRCAGRIGEASFDLNGVTITLPNNDGKHHLHGGTPGFSHRLWEAEVLDDRVIMTLTSFHGYQGYPGTLQLSVTFSLMDDNGLAIRYHAKSDADTVLNLTNHTYFNLAGAGNGDICSHYLQIPSSQRLETDEDWIPTGKFLNNQGTEYDFRFHSLIGATVYNDYYLLLPSKGVQAVAEAIDTSSGRTLQVLSDQPGLQLYTGYYLDDPYGRDGKTYGAFSGFCIETQHPPDAPNHPHFPSSLLPEGISYESTTIFKFGTLT